MLIRKVRAKGHAWPPLFPCKRSLQPVGPSSSTLLGWFRLAPIDQYSSLLPPVGVWTVSQFQCGGPSSQNPYPHPHPSPMNLYLGCHAASQGHRALIFLSKGCSRVKARLDTCYSPVRRSPAKVASYLPAAPRLACVKPVASVHPEPGSNSPL